MRRGITSAAWLSGGLLTASLARPGEALAFPYVDPTNQDTIPTGVPVGTDLPDTDATILGNQLRLANPAASARQGPWTILPRLSVDELFTDNALEATAPRRFDAATLVAPGVTVIADTARLKLNFDYQPNLILHAVDGPLNVITQQLSAIGLVTVVPDLAYVDVRAVSGVQSAFGAFAGTSTLGGSTASLTGTAGTGAAGYSTGEGLNRLNEAQTSSYGISPYLLRRFGDYGTAKVGVSVNAARTSTIDGFVASPVPAGGTNGQSALTTEQFARFTTGQILAKFQDTVDVDLQQSRTRSDSISAIVANTNTTASVPGDTFTSTRQTFNNQLSYALNHTFTVLASIGEQRISYSGTSFANINGPIWSVGFIYSPGPETSVTVTYGHQDGATGFNANGHVPVGGRSLLTLSYNDTVGTQLENLQNQLNNSTVGQNGALISALNGGPLLIASNTQGLQNGIYRYKTASASFLTQWPRDAVQATLSWVEQTSLTPALALSSITFDPVTGNAILNTVPTTSAALTTSSTAALSWAHELSPNMVMSTGATYSFIHRSGDINDSSLATAIGLQYTLSPSTLLNARYSFFDRVSKIPGYSLYENLLLLGLTKQF